MDNNWNGTDSKILSGTLSKLGLPVKENEQTNEERRNDAINSIGNILASYYKELYEQRKRQDSEKIKETSKYIEEVKNIISTRMRGLIYINDSLEKGKLYDVLRNLITNKIEELDSKEKITDSDKFVSESVKFDFEEMLQTLDLTKEQTNKNKEEIKKQEIHRAGPYKPDGADWQHGETGGVVYGDPSTYARDGFHTKEFHERKMKDRDER